ncbi:MAG: OsmC family protein [Chthoniobacteraceae bacterium]
MTTTLAYHAAGRGLNIESIESQYEGDIDLHGLVDLDPKVRPGYREIRVKFKVKRDADEQTIQEWLRKSPVFDTLANPVKIKVEVEKV